MISMPLACVPGAIPAEERPAHFELIRRLFDSARETRPLQDGYAFAFDPNALMDLAGSSRTSDDAAPSSPSRSTRTRMEVRWGCG